MRVAASINPDQPTRGKCHVTVSVHLAGLTENMTINVVVARDADGVQEAGNRKSKRFRATFRESDLNQYAPRNDCAVSRTTSSSPGQTSS